MHVMNARRFSKRKPIALAASISLLNATSSLARLFVKFLTQESCATSAHAPLSQLDMISSSSHCSFAFYDSMKERIESLRITRGIGSQIKVPAVQAIGPWRDKRLRSPLILW